MGFYSLSYHCNYVVWVRNITIVASILFLFSLISAAFSQENKPDAPDVSLFKRLLGSNGGNVDSNNDNFDEKPASSGGSIMYNKDDIRNIEKALESYKTKIPLEILLPDIFPPIIVKDDTPQPEQEVIDEVVEDDIVQHELMLEPEPEKVVAPEITDYFYLSSILYFLPSSWSIWLNNQKISSTGEFEENISIVKVSRKEIYFLMNNAPLAFFDKWKHNFLSLGNQVFISKQNNILVDEASKRVSFILKPNQSIITRKLQVVEGSAKPIVEAYKREQQSVTENISGTIENVESEIEEITEDVLPYDSQQLAEGIKNMAEYKKQIDTLQNIINKGGL